MPSYEIALIVRSSLSRPKLKNAVKGACGQIVKQGGLIKQIENHGHRQLPEVMRAHHQDHKYGHYFSIQFECCSEGLTEIDRRYRQTPEYVKFGVLKKEAEPRRPCLDGPCLFGELQNPDHDKTAYTKSVLNRFRVGRMSNV